MTDQKFRSMEEVGILLFFVGLLAWDVFLMSIFILILKKRRER